MNIKNSRCNLWCSGVMSNLLEGAKPRGSIVSKYGFSLHNSGRHGQETSWRVER